jgi:hypothetical protein
MKKYLATFILSAAVLCACLTAQSKSESNLIAKRAAGEYAASPFTAIVKADEAQFTLPLPQRSEWRWLLPETKDRAQEYRMDVTVKNGATEYTFGFYLWKRAGAKPGQGSFSDLLEAGQKGLFERPPSARGFALVQDAGVKVSERGDTLLITIGGRSNVARLFSSKPPQATFTITVPGDGPRRKLVPVKYED